MRYPIILLLILFLVAGCAKQMPGTVLPKEVPQEKALPVVAPIEAPPAPELSPEPVPLSEMTDEQILEEYDDDLDAALAELDMLE